MSPVLQVAHLAFMSESTTFWNGSRLLVVFIHRVIVLLDRVSVAQKKKLVWVLGVLTDWLLTKTRFGKSKNKQNHIIYYMIEHFDFDLLVTVPFITSVVHCSGRSFVFAGKN